MSRYREHTDGLRHGKHEHSEVFFVMIGIILIICVSLYDFSSLKSIFVIDDTFGYWGNAALIAGKPWATSMADIPYYSPGYSVLLLPIIRLFKTPETMYHMAIMLNVMFLVGSYLCAIYAGRRLFPQMAHTHIILGALVAVLTPARIIYTRITLTENLLGFIIWIDIILFLLLEDSKGKFCYSAIIMGLGFAKCFIHGRCLPLVLIEDLIIIVYYCVNRKMGKVLLSVAMCGLAFFAYTKLQDYHEASIFANSIKDAGVVNDISPVHEIKRYLLVLILNTLVLAKSVISKAFTGIAMTYMALPIVVCNTINCLFTAKKEKGQENYLLAKLFVSLGLVAMILLTSFRMTDNYRADMIVYSRYYDFLIEPAILMGLCMLLENYKRYKRLFLITGLAMVIMSVPVFIDASHGLHGFSGMASPFIGGILEMAGNSMGIETGYKTWVRYYEYRIYIVGGFILQNIIIIYILLVNRYCGNKWVKAYKYVLPGILAVSMILGLTLNQKHDEIRTVYHQNTMKICNEMKDDKRKIYYLDQWNGSVGCAEYIQFELMDREMQVITLAGADKILSDSWIISGESLDGTSLKNRSEYIMRENGMYLYLYNGT